MLLCAKLFIFIIGFILIFMRDAGCVFVVDFTDGYSFLIGLFFFNIRL